MNRNCYGFTAWVKFAFIAALSSSVHAQIQFENVTSTAGYFHIGESWGSSWGDLNADARPDLFVSNHRDRASIYRNNGDGTFTDVVLTVDQSHTWLNLPLGDTHGGTWTDFDSDGDQDMIIATGTQIPPHLFVNDNGLFTDQTTALGIPDDGGGRMSAVFDFNDDTLIDFAVMNSGTSMILEQQAAGGFVKVNNNPGVQFDCNGFRSNYAQLTDINDDVTLGGDLEFFCMRDGTSPAKVFDTSTSPFTDITATVPTAANVVDTVTADFDRNLLPDIFMVRGALRPGQILEVSPQKVEVSLAVSSVSGEKDFYFTSSGTLDVEISTRSFGVFRVFIGSTGIHPADLIFTLDPADPDTWGIMPHDPVVDPGLYIGYDTATQEWRFQLSPGGSNQNIYAIIDSSAPVSGLDLDNLSTGEFPLEPRLFMNTAGVLQDETNGSGLDTLLLCVHAVAADLDNDMDEDLYVVCRGGVENIENRLYENQGDGTFVEILDAGGAEGVIGAGLDSGAGTGESVTYGDYDMDGFLDLLVLNGLNLQPLHVGGPNELFRNLGNSNHWIQLDLVGTASNIDAVGTRVLATAGGITQLRERNGSYHRWSHDTQRVHFGLGSNTTVDLTVYWPNGDSDLFTNIAADEFYTITQGASGSGNGTIQPVVLGPVPEFPAPVSGDECGEPIYTGNLDRAIFIWKDCVNDSWHIQAMAGGDPTTQTYSGTIVSDQPFTSVTGVLLEGSDTLDTSDPNVIDFTLKMSNGGRDGIDFTFPSGAEVCFDPSTLPDGAQVLVGSKHLPAPVPMNLQTLEGCINLSIDDVEVSEAAGTASFTVSLSSPSSSPVSVDYTTVDGSATAGADYTAVTNTLTFDPGQTSKPIDVPILQDTEGEGTEDYTVVLSNASSGSILDDTGLGTITDDDTNPCGQPNYSAGSDLGVFIWKDCDGSEQWYMRTTAGGSPTKVSYEGTVSSNQGFTSVVPFSIEASDTLDNTTDPNVINYVLGMKNSGTDGFDFTFPAGATTCFDVTLLPAGAQVILGSDENVMSGPFDLTTLGPCTGLSIDDVEVSEADGTASFTVTLSSPSSNTVMVDYTTVDGSATAGADYTAVTNTLTFDPGQISKPIDVPILQDTEGEGTEDYTVVLSNASNASITDDTGLGTITDDDTNPCGQPNYSAGSDQGVFIWKDCGGSEQWHMRTTAGGSPTKVSYEGTVSSNQGFNSLIPFSIEASDTLDNTTDPNVINYVLGMKNSGTDGFDFTFPAGATTCFDVTLLPAGAQVILGSDDTVMPEPFDLTTLGPCTGLSIDDVEVSEADGTASFTVTLSSPSSNTVMVDYTTVDGSATAGADYTAVTNTLTFDPGQISKPIDVPILQDTEGEGTEDYTVVLSNASNASIADDTGLGTITDDDISPCGQPSYNRSTDQGVFIWKDCGGSEQWHMRTTAGGSPTKVSYEGTVSSSLGFTSLTPYSIEASDTLDNTTDPNEIVYILGMRNSGEDGFDFTFPAGATTCFDATLLPAGAHVELGSDNTIMNDPFDLVTRGPCL